MQHKFEQKEKFSSEAFSVPIQYKKYWEYYKFCIIENNIGATLQLHYM